ncbi:MAG: CHAP domain-containing protein, partial [Paludibacteraceae bacterium]|nr:CHAP domain-containing protein [Paludibacteraceae bacterium]
MKKLYLFLFIILSCFIIRGQTNCVTPFGTLLGSFNGVDAYSNCNTNYYSEIHNYWGGTYTGIKWQCVEYVNRYYKIVYGLDLFGTKCFGNANSYYSNAKNAGLLAYPNGGSIAPQVGDILCSNGMTYGHVAIVMEVGTNFVKVIHQNFSNSNCFMTLNRSGNTVSGFNGNYPIEGWVRYQNQTISIPATPTNLSPGSINSPGPTLTSTNVTLSWSASAGATYYDLGVRDMSTNTLVVDATTNSTTYTVTLQAGKTYRWNVAAANSAGKSKFTDPLYFTIAASTPTPTITSIYPSSIAGSNSLQPITIYGTNFQPTSYLIFTDPHGNTYNSSNYPERFTYVNSGQINYNINNMNDCGTWYVRVYNSSSVYSNSYSFNVGCCSYTLSFYSLSVSYSSGNGSVNVSTSSGCSWTASSNNSSWLNITSGSSGNGSGTVYFSFSENTSSSSRTGTITIANQTFTITQAGKASTPTPTITSIYPSSITGSNSLQPITIYGTNFQPTSYLIFTDPHGNTYNSSNYPERFTYVN